MDAPSDPNVTFSSFIADPTLEQHIPEALVILRLVNTLQTYRSNPHPENVDIRQLHFRRYGTQRPARQLLHRQNLSEPGYVQRKLSPNAKCSGCAGRRPIRKTTTSEGRLLIASKLSCKPSSLNLIVYEAVSNFTLASIYKKSLLEQT